MSNNTKKTKLFVATPMYGGMCVGYYTEAMMGLAVQCKERDIDMAYSYLINESLIQRARNTLANIFVDESDFTHLLFIDGDIRFNPSDVFKLLDHDKEIICGIYPKKDINWKSVSEAVKDGANPDDLQYSSASMVINLIDYQHAMEVQVGDAVEVQNAGTGFMLIKREVFEKLKMIVPSYSKRGAALYSKDEKDFDAEYFACSIQEGTNILLSEDYHFCEIARKHGVRVWADPSVRLSHFGTYLFQGYFKSV